MNHEVNIAVQCTATYCTVLQPSRKPARNKSLTLKLDFIQFLNCTCSCSVYFTPVIIYYILLVKSKILFYFREQFHVWLGLEKTMSLQRLMITVYLWLKSDLGRCAYICTNFALMQSWRCWFIGFPTFWLSVSGSAKLCWSMDPTKTC